MSMKIYNIWSNTILTCGHAHLNRSLSLFPQMVFPQWPALLPGHLSKEWTQMIRNESNTISVSRQWQQLRSNTIRHAAMPVYLLLLPLIIFPRLTASCVRLSKEGQKSLHPQDCKRWWQRTDYPRCVPTNSKKKTLLFHPCQNLPSPQKESSSSWAPTNPTSWTTRPDQLRPISCEIYEKQLHRYCKGSSPCHMRPAKYLETWNKPTCCQSIKKD